MCVDRDQSFRLPRKVKKKLRKTIWLYPPDEKGNSLMAWPSKCQKDYDSIKLGIVRDIMSRSNKAKRRQNRKLLNKEIVVSDEQLRVYVDKIFAKEFRNSFYHTLIEAKKTPKATVAYYNFINAFLLFEKGKESYGNICCLSVDYAKELLKK